MLFWFLRCNDINYAKDSSLIIYDKSSSFLFELILVRIIIVLERRIDMPHVRAHWIVWIIHMAQSRISVSYYSFSTVISIRIPFKIWITVDVVFARSCWVWSRWVEQLSWVHRITHLLFVKFESLSEKWTSFRNSQAFLKSFPCNSRILMEVVSITSVLKECLLSSSSENCPEY